jgi:copper transport protein
MMTARRALAAMAAGLFLVLLGPASPASAHAALVATNPAQGSTVATAPTEVTLTFSESITAVNDKIRVIGPDGSRADQNRPAVSGATLRIPLRPNLPIGTYLVSYRIISADSHPVPGGFTFNIGAPSARTPQPADQGKTDAFVTVAIPVFKYLGYAGLLLVAGASLILLLLWPSRLPQKGPRNLLTLGFGLVVLSACGGFLLQAPYENGTTIAQTTASDWSAVLSSQFGAVMLARIGVLAVGAVVLSAALRRVHTDGEAARSDLIVLGILGAVLAATWPLAGHAAASPVPPVTVVIDSVHIASMAVWLGGLAMLAIFLLRPGPNQANDRELGAILPVWSRWATLAVSALLLAGVVQALIEIGSVSALFTTTYGRLILVKVGLVAVILGFAYFARRSVHGIEHAEDGGRVVRRSVAVELAIAVVVLGFSAVLTQTTPARVAQAAPPVTAAQQNYFSTTAATDLYTLQVDFDPARVGENSVHLYAYTKEGKPLKVVEWSGTAALPTGGIEPVTIPLLPLTDNHVTGSIQLPTAGDWQMRFTLRTTDVDQETVSVTVPIR